MPNVARMYDYVLGGCHNVTRLLDFGRPVAVLLNAVLHFVSDADDPAGIIGRIRGNSSVAAT